VFEMENLKGRRLVSGEIRMKNRRFLRIPEVPKRIRDRVFDHQTTDFSRYAGARSCGQARR